MKQVHSYRQKEEANQERWDSTTAERKSIENGVV